MIMQYNRVLDEKNKMDKELDNVCIKRTSILYYIIFIYIIFYIILHLYICTLIRKF